MYISVSNIAQQALVLCWGMSNETYIHQKTTNNRDLWTNTYKHVCICNRDLYIYIYMYVWICIFTYSSQTWILKRAHVLQPALGFWPASISRQKCQKRPRKETYKRVFENMCKKHDMYISMWVWHGFWPASISRQMCQKRPTKETYKRNLLTRKETGKRDQQKRLFPK